MLLNAKKTRFLNINKYKGVKTRKMKMLVITQN